MNGNQNDPKSSLSNTVEDNVAAFQPVLHLFMNKVRFLVIFDHFPLTAVSVFIHPH